MIEIKPWYSILNSDAPATYKDMEGISIGYEVYLAFKDISGKGYFNCIVFIINSKIL